MGRRAPRRPLHPSPASQRIRQWIEAYNLRGSACPVDCDPSERQPTKSVLGLEWLSQAPVGRWDGEGEESRWSVRMQPPERSQPTI